MAFVNEKISEVDKQRIDFSKIKHPVGGHPVIPNQWTVDHERDIALIYLGGEQSEDLKVFILYWKGQTPAVYLKASSTGNFMTNDLEATWFVNSVGVPNDVAREEVLKTLKEALLTFGYETISLRDKVKAVHFKF